jgi:two-component system, LytTR family, response regulator
MALEVIIVDDEPASRRTLKECCAREPDLRVIGEYGDSRTALEAIRTHPPDLLFLDIQIDSLTGIEIARSLDPQTLPQIVFVTAYDHYALEAFEVSAIDYLLKPFDDARFQTTLARVRSRADAQNRAQRQVALSSLLEQLERSVRSAYDTRPRVIAEADGRMHVLDVAQIEVLESDRNYVKITVGRAQYSTRSTLAQAEQWLQSQPMLKISRSCLVNMSHVREFSQTPRGDAILVLAGGVTVTSSEGYRDAVRQHLDRMRIGR